MSGTKDTENLLRKAGFKILGKNLREVVITSVDNKDHFGYVEADYTVTKDRKKYAVMIQSKEEISDPADPLLRPKLLELNRAFLLDGVLLVNPEKEKMHIMRFRFPHERNLDFFFQFFIGLFIVFVVIGIIWMLVMLRLL